MPGLRTLIFDLKDLDKLAQAEQKLFLMAWHLERLGKKSG